MIINAVYFFQWFFLIYMVCLSFCYLLLNIIAIISMVRYMRAYRMDYFLDSFSEFQPPISVLVPAHNEAKSIVASVRALMQLIYSEYEVIVINDGSSDQTLQILKEAFKLTPIPEAYPVRIPVKQRRGYYRSDEYHNLKVIDKENGGKADALNTGINASRYPLFCSIDADSILQRDSLHRIVQAFMNDPKTIAAGGTIRILNGSQVREGHLIKAELPRKLLVRMQIVEYLRAFLFGRFGWSPINGMLIISGAFGLFNKQMVIDVGGYQTNTIGEDMELVARLHRHAISGKQAYKIAFVPDPICWTEVPEDLASLKNQRIRWQKGLYQSLTKNLSLAFNYRNRVVGWLSFPFMVVFECLGPLIEVLGYVFVILAFVFGLVSLSYFLLFFLLAVGLGMLISVTALLLEEISFHIYGSYRQILSLFWAAILENFGYRQLLTVWRLQGLWQAMTSQERAWGTILRNAGWQKN